LTATDRRQKAEGRKKKRQKKEDRQGRGKAKQQMSKATVFLPSQRYRRRLEAIWRHLKNKGARPLTKSGR
jgi:hypothetical protein